MRSVRENNNHTMKRITFLRDIGIMIIFLFLAFSCKHNKEQPECGDPAPTLCNVVLVDKNDSILIGKKYSQDSVNLTLNDKKLNFYIYNGIITINFDTLQSHSGDNYILYLNFTDQDTLNLFVRTVNTTDCGSFRTLDSLDYNGKHIVPTQNKLTYRVQKN